MTGMLGQQVVAGKRLPGGMIRSSFVSGMTATEVFAHATASRVGVMDTSVTAPTVGDMTRKIMNAANNAIVQHDGTVRNAGGEILAFAYGDDGLDPVHTTIRQLEASLLPSGTDGWTAAGFAEAIGASDATLLELPNVEGVLDRDIRVQPGEPVGALAAQSVGQVMLQLTLNTFHHAGQAGSEMDSATTRTKQLFDVQLPRVVQLTITGTSRTVDRPLLKSGCERTVLDLARAPPKFMDAPLSDNMNGMPMLMLGPMETGKKRLMVEANAIRAARSRALGVQGGIRGRSKKGEIREAYPCALELDLLPTVDSVDVDVLVRLVTETHPGIMMAARKGKSVLLVVSWDLVEGLLRSDLESLVWRHVAPLRLSGLPGVRALDLTTTRRAVALHAAWPPRFRIAREGDPRWMLRASYTVPDVPNPIKTAADDFRTFMVKTAEEGVFDWRTTNLAWPSATAQVLGVEAARRQLVDEAGMVFRGLGRRHIKLVADIMTHEGGIRAIKSAVRGRPGNDVLSMAVFEAPMNHLYAGAAMGAKDDLARVNRCGTCTSHCRIVLIFVL
jgi:hypothetical protein